MHPIGIAQCTTSDGELAEWWRSGLQIRVHRFDSGTRLQILVIHFNIVSLFSFNLEINWLRGIFDALKQWSNSSAFTIELYNNSDYYNKWIYPDDIKRKRAYHEHGYNSLRITSRHAILLWRSYFINQETYKVRTRLFFEWFFFIFS